MYQELQPIYEYYINKYVSKNISFVPLIKINFFEIKGLYWNLKCIKKNYTIFRGGFGAASIY